MADPIRDLAERFAAMERRLHALETAPRANKTSVRNGHTRWLATGEGDYPNIRIGATTEDGGDPALEVTNTDGGFADIYIGTNAGRGRADLYNRDKSGLVLRVDDGYMEAPQASCAWQRYVGSSVDAVGMSTTNSATYVDLWHSVLPLGTDAIATVIDVVPDGGVTADVRIIGAVIGGIHNGSPAAAQQINDDIGITTTVVIQDGPWTVPDAIWSPAADPSGTLLWVTIQARVTAGSPSVVHVAPRLPVWVS